MLHFSKFILLVALLSGCGVAAKNTPLAVEYTQEAAQAPAANRTAIKLAANNAQIVEKTQTGSNTQAIDDQGVPVFAQGLVYASVRKKLLSAGWQPHISRFADKCLKNDSRCIGRPEMEACSGAGAGNCKFVWEKGSTLLNIFTVGMQAEFESSSTYSKP